MRVPVTLADAIRAHPAYREEYVPLRERRESKGNSIEIRRAIRDACQQIVSDLEARGWLIASAQIAQAYKYERAGLKPQGRPSSPEGKAGLRERVKDLEMGIARALLALRSGDVDKARHELRAVMPGKGRAA